MPLPPALAARLAQRGLINKEASNQPPSHQPSGGFSNRRSMDEDDERDDMENEEEVFAEDYDDNEAPPGYQEPDDDDDGTEMTTQQEAPIVDKTKYIGHSGCPNKWNVYHNCVLHCRSFWAGGHKEPPDTEYIRVHNMMIEKFYPLPDGWREMYDAGTGRHYYWCTKTDKVSWLPPGHPRADITEAASKIREMLTLQAEMVAKTRGDRGDDEDKMSLDSEADDSDREEEEENRRLEEQRRREKEKRKEEEKNIAKKKEKEKEKRKIREEDPLDPMDPAAYSEVPRGTWTTGLPDQSTAKSGVDSTASGPLFQQRPYPNPGAVLRANAAAKKDEDSE